MAAASFLRPPLRAALLAAALAALPMAGTQAEAQSTAPPAAFEQTATPEATPPSPAEAAPRATLPRDLSPVGMFLGADRVVKAVMIGLALASLASWIIWLAKSLELAGARREARRVRRAVAGAASLAGAGKQGTGPAALMLAAAREEAAMSAPALAGTGQEHHEGLKERVASALAEIAAHAGRRMARGTGILASIGATAPFVGLFGTVWGIMNAFIGISEAQTTNLAVVAPGIAEALMATAAGLIAAIPAVVLYNILARATAAYRALLADTAGGIERLVSRDLDFGRLGTTPEAD